MTSLSQLLHTFPLFLRFVLLAMALSGLNAFAQTCPDSTPPGTEHPAALSPSIDYSHIPVEFSFDSGSSILNGASELSGAKVSQGERSISADTVHYDFTNQTLKADGNVTYEDPQLRVTGRDANMDSNAGVEFDKAEFGLKKRAGRGSASSIKLSPQGNLHLDAVRYTTCPVNQPDWELKLSSLDIDQSTRTGVGRNVLLEFKDVPLFYTPWISFPVGNERKSGFLFPNFRSSSRGGYSLLVPWYWNIASNYDATFTPVVDSLRGAELDSEFRYLNEKGNGTVLANYLPHDRSVNDWRGLLQLKHLTDFNPHLRLVVDATTVSDRRWFEDFGQSRDETSQVYLNRQMSFSAYSENWLGSIAVQNLQILDSQMLDPSLAATRPYTVLPRITVIGHEDKLPFGFDFNFDSELSYFTRGNPASSTGVSNDTITGARLYASPTLSLPLRAPGMYVVPSTSWRYTAYQLHGGTSAQDSSPMLSAPVSSLDMGMIFERLSSGEQRLYTLQPRVLYTYAPYRRQATLPVFDTDLPDFNLVQLFRTDRFVGRDRLGDTNQISAGITTRMLDAHTGGQFLSGTLGQAFYLKTPCVVSIISDSCSAAVSTHSSPIIGQITLSAYRNWTASMGMQWDPVQSRTERSEVNFQYLPGHNRVINLSYRFARADQNQDVAGATNNINAGATDAGIPFSNQVDQWETSFAWPVGVNWSTYGRLVYSNLDKELHDYLGGLEYRSCCWNLRLVFGRSITTRQGNYDTRISLQFEFKGLGSAGTADTFLQNAIPGYSARQP